MGESLVELWSMFPSQVGLHFVEEFRGGVVFLSVFLPVVEVLLDFLFSVLGDEGLYGIVGGFVKSEVIEQGGFPLVVFGRGAEMFFFFNNNRITFFFFYGSSMCVIMVIYMVSGSDICVTWLTLVSL